MEYKTSLFSDDTLISLRGEPRHFELALQCIETFSAMSGCNMNWSKSTDFYIGSLRGKELRPMVDKGLAWSPDVINYLGIKYPIAGHLQHQIFELNFGNNLARIKTIINIWSARHLTLLGKIIIIKSLVIPILTYKLSQFQIEIPKNFI